MYCATPLEHHVCKRPTMLDKPPLIPSPHLKVQIVMFTYFNGCFLEATITQNHTKHDVSILHLPHLGWQTLPPPYLTLQLGCIVPSISPSPNYTILRSPNPNSKLFWKQFRQMQWSTLHLLWSSNMSSPNSSRSMPLMLYIPSHVH